MSIKEWTSKRVFGLVHGHNLVYNTCWEDPRLDRRALRLGPDDRVLVITSAGCNALDYALAGPRQVIAVDMNPRQNALLELKMAGIRHLRYEDFFAMFGRGKLDRAGKIYGNELRPALSPWAQRYWDRWIEFFEMGNHRPFYFRGASGAFAMLINLYINCIARLRRPLNDLLAARSLDDQRNIFDRHIRDQFWSRPMRYALSRDAVLSLVGVPPDQRRQLEMQYQGGIVQFIYDCLEAVFARLPLTDNYFWRVYMTGEYATDCCPEYLKPANFQRLKDGLVDRIETHTDSVQSYLEKHETPVSRFVLLDHMDWLSGPDKTLLEREWQWIVSRATAKARVIWRSAGLRTDFVDDARVVHAGRLCRVGELLRYDLQFAAELHAQCRVHTYGSFHIADLAA